VSQLVEEAGQKLWAVRVNSVRLLIFLARLRPPPRLRRPGVPGFAQPATGDAVLPVPTDGAARHRAQHQQDGKSKEMYGQTQKRQKAPMPPLRRISDRTSP
jgi:hypothetical protein